MGGEGFFEAFGLGVTAGKIARRLVSLAILARNVFRLWVETEMFRGGKEGDRLRGFVGRMRTMIHSVMRGERVTNSSWRILMWVRIGWRFWGRGGWMS